MTLSNPVYRDSGFTIIELVLVIVVISMMASMMGGQFSSVRGWRTKSGLRALIRTWELVCNEAITKNSNYRLIFDLDNQSYYVRREIQSAPDHVQYVDRAKNLRSEKEKERRSQEEAEELPSIEEEFQKEDENQNQDLDKVFFSYIFSDPGAGFRLGLPIWEPSMGEPTRLPDDLVITGVKVRGRVEQDGQPFIRVSARSGSEFAVVYVKMGEQEFSLLNDPGASTFSIKDGHVDFNWILGGER